MNLNKTLKNKYYIASIILLLFSLFLFFNPTVQNYFKSISENESRVVLSKIKTKKLNDQIELTLIKVKHQQKIYLEIYAHMNHGLELIEKITLDGEFDAYVILKDRTTNLMISNIDRTNDLEIIAPTYDRRMKPILNVYKYDSAMEEFRKVNSKFSKPIL